MRFFWSVMFAGGLLLAGLDVYEARREAREAGKGRPAVMMLEDGTPMPTPPPPPPK